MSNIFKFHRRTNNAPAGFVSRTPTVLWSTKAIGAGNTTDGYKAGTIKNGSNIQYSLIVCPRSNGQATTADLSKVFNTTNDAVPASLSALGNGTTTPTGGIAGQFYGSLWDGLSNTNALYSASSTNYIAVNYCKSLTTGGYNDWYLPAKDELELCYRSFKPITGANTTSFPTYTGGNNSSSVPQFNQSYTTSDPAQTTITAFKSGGTEAFATTDYWSSCEASSTNAWRQSFIDGMVYGNDTRMSPYNIRPVRRSLL
jgi:hypothetical protein